MKKKFLILFMLLATLGTLTACSKKDTYHGISVESDVAQTLKKSENIMSKVLSASSDENISKFQNNIDKLDSLLSTETEGEVETPPEILLGNGDKSLKKYLNNKNIDKETIDKIINEFNKVIVDKFNK